MCARPAGVSSRRVRLRRSRVSRRSGCSICSKVALTKSCPHSPRRDAELWRSRSCGTRLAGRLLIGARLRWRYRPCCRRSARRSRCSSRSTMSSGSMGRPRRRLRSRCGGRTRRSCVRTLLTRRVGRDAHLSDLERALGFEHIGRLSVGPLSVGALHRLLRDRLGRPFARQTLLRIHEGSGGNPFFALEIARALGEDLDSGQPLPVPQTLEELGAWAHLGSPRAHARGARPHRGPGITFGVAARASGSRVEHARAGVRRAGARARERDDPLHTPTARVGLLCRAWTATNGAPRPHRRGSRRPAGPRSSPCPCDDDGRS